MSDGGDKYLVREFDGQLTPMSAALVAMREARDMIHGPQWVYSASPSMGDRELLDLKLTMRSEHEDGDRHEKATIAFAAKHFERDVRRAWWNLKYAHLRRIYERKPPV